MKIILSQVTLGITTLLSMTVFLMVIGESMPPTSEKLPLIGELQLARCYLETVSHPRSVLRGDHLPGVPGHRPLRGHPQPPPQGPQRSQVRQGAKHFFTCVSF